MSFFRAALTFAASTGTKLFANLIIVKVIALYIGADGLGQLGQFMSVMNMVTILAGGGIFTGLLKYIAEFRNDSESLNGYLSSASMIALAASGIVAILLFVCAGPISYLLIGTAEYADVIYVLAIVQFLIGANNYAVSVINGCQDVRGYALVTIAGTLLGGGVSYLAITRGGLRGAMYGMIFMPAAMAVFSIPYVLRRMVTFAQLVPRYDRTTSIKLLRYSAMLCVTVCTMPMAQIAIRKLIENRASWTAVGYWQGVTKISDAYLMFIHVILGNYYLPRLSSKLSTIELKHEVYKTMMIIIPVTATLSFSVYLFRDFIISVLFAKSFAPMREFFFYQMVGDFLKICAYTIGYVAVAKAMTKIYIFAEIIQSLMFVLLASVFLKSWGPVGITYAYAMNYAIYFAISLFVFFRYLVKNKPADHTADWRTAQ